MELVALSDQQLHYLATRDCLLNRHFVGVFPSDKLPKKSPKGPSAYIVNTDPHDKPGKHWLAIWVKDGVCEIMDSYGLPLKYYEATPLEKWTRQWKYIVTNGRALQSIRSNSCGHYCLFYLKAKVRDASLQDFLNYFEENDYVSNDHKVGQMLKELITDKTEWEKVCKRPYKQHCTSCQ